METSVEAHPTNIEFKLSAATVLRSSVVAALGAGISALVSHEVTNLLFLRSVMNSLEAEILPILGVAVLGLGVCLSYFFLRKA
jgi:hypothetical protein